MKFSNYLTHLREKTSLNKKELATKVGVTPTYISNFEHGRNRPPDVELCTKIADALKINESERKKLFELAIQERPRDFDFHQVIQGPSERIKLTKEVTEALLNPIAVQALLITHGLDKKSAKTMEEAIKILATMNPDKIEALLRLVK